MSKESMEKTAIGLSGNPNYIIDRNNIVSLHKSGKSRKEIMMELHMSYQTVRTTIHWFRKQK